MRIEVKVIPNAQKDKVLQEEGKLRVYVASPAIRGRANKDLIKILAGHFKVKKDAVRIIKGEKSRQKVIEIGS